MNLGCLLEGEGQPQSISRIRFKYLIEGGESEAKEKPLHRQYFEQYQKNKGNHYQLSQEKIGNFQTVSLKHGSSNDVIQLQKENSELKKDLLECLCMNESLRKELKMAQDELFSKKEALKLKQEQSKRQSALIDEQLRDLLEKNRFLQMQLSALKEILTSKNEYFVLKQSARALKDSSNIRYDSLTCTTKGKDALNATFNSFFERIRDMQLKITGVVSQSHQELWRWLKQIGRTYSQFKKWREKVTKWMQSKQLTFQVCLILIKEGIGLKG